MHEVIEASETRRWRDALAAFERVDVCHMPEYHQAYALRFAGARALMWRYRSGAETLCYPFLFSPVWLQGADGRTEDTGYADISGIYGYSGPLTTCADDDFLGEAWAAFDRWAGEHRLLCEFIRFSSYVGNQDWAHPLAAVEYNRPVAIAILPDDADLYLSQLPGKTRNMIRKARKAGLEARRVEIAAGLAEFDALYRLTMERNRAPGFFDYDQAYYDRLLALPPGELLMSGVYRGAQMVAAAIGLAHAGMAFYHLGASTLEASRQGAGNLALFDLASRLIENGVGFFSVGGGRGTDEQDPLFRFKRSNATSQGRFYIGKRVLDAAAYEWVVNRWETMNDTRLSNPRLQFYR